MAKEVKKMQHIVHKAALTQKIYLKVTYDERTDKTLKNRPNETSTDPVHDDLREAFKQLAPHMAFICEQVKDTPDLKKAMSQNERVKPTSELASTLDDFYVQGFTITRNEDIRSFTIFGHRVLHSKKTMPFSTPTIKETEDYEYMKELISAMNRAEVEVINYLNGKHAPDVQQDMFAGQSNEETQTT